MSDDERVNLHRCTGRTAAGKRCRRNAEEGSTRCATHGYKAPGRPSKLTPDLAEQIIYLILEGNYLEVAAQANGVDRRTLQRWRQRGEDALAVALEQVDPDADDRPDLYELLDPAEWLYLDFCHALKSAEAYAETELLRKAATGYMGWQAPMTVLERRHHSRWRRSEHREVSGDVVGRVEVVEVDETDKRQEIANVLVEAGAVPKPTTTSTTSKGRGKAKGTPKRKRGK